MAITASGNHGSADSVAGLKYKRVALTQAAIRIHHPPNAFNANQIVESDSARAVRIPYKPFGGTSFKISGTLKMAITPQATKSLVKLTVGTPLIVMIDWI